MYDFRSIFIYSTSESSMATIYGGESRDGTVERSQFGFALIVL